jgi:acyl-coenzyme A synthetase/AMP-(fatty) acid ligase/acyl carrier protein
VRIPHRAVVNYLTWMRDAYGVGARDAILQKAPASFDASVWELFLPLVSGARLVLAPAAAPQDPEVLLAAVRRHGVSLLQLVPSQLRMLLEAGAVGADLASVRRLFLGGEALPAELLAQIQARCPTLAVTNLYGPTEATVYATHWDVEPGTWAPGDAVLIGTPIANARVHVIDGQGRLVPDGAAGEILIAGDGVAAGYLNRPELDAERFIPDPFGRAGAIAYRTGDRGRLRVDGGIEYLGRADGQVKLRGFRVELGEIESVLGRQPEVASAVAMIRDDGAGSQMLVAYCVAAPRWSAAERGALTRSVRERLRGALPAFMIPAAIVWLDAWPMNANGKLDRARLPAPTMAASAASEYVPPRTEVERAIAAAWAEVLGREQVGVTDDFFALGGHSLAALRISLRVHDLLGVRLPLATILERASVERLAEVAEAQRTTAAPTDGAIRRVARDAYRRARVSEGGSS